MTLWEDSPYRCEICKQGLDRDSPSTAKRVTGWMKNGSTALRHAGPPVAWAHWVCLDIRVPQDQAGLF